MNKKLLAVLLFCFYFLCPLAEASLFQQTDKVAVELIYKNDGINPEENVEFLFKFLLKNGWHIFSNNPGEIGMPTQVEWKIPQGYEILREQWSLGRDFDTEGIIQNGYDTIAYYKVIMKPSPDLWREVPFKARVSWLACQEECVPESLRFNFSLPVVHVNSRPSPLWSAENTMAIQSFEMMPQPSQEEPHWFIIMIMAFGGGLILNFMPCIFPILSLKAISLAQGSRNRRQARFEALLYFCGVLLSFLLTATLLIGLRRGGEQIGWGFQLQSPVFVGFMIVVFTLIFLMLLDIVKIRMPWMNKIGRISMGQKRFSAFMTGFFAVLIASPCTAPFMGVAIGYTLTQPLYIAYPVFAALGIGYALPFSLVSLFPHVIHHFIPRPGRWMDILKKLFAIPIFLTCLWLFWVLQNQIDITSDKEEGIVWQKFDREQFETLLEEHQPVFIDFTAKWCITCLVNEKTSLSSDKFLRLVKKNGITLFKGDWTNRDETISKALESFGRSSVPLYIYYDGTGGYKILPQILSPGIVSEYLD